MLFVAYSRGARRRGNGGITSQQLIYVDAVLEEELGPMYVGVHNFHETYFGDVADLETASAAVFRMCMEGDRPLFREGWSGWPEDATQDHVLGWFAELSEKLAAFAEDYWPGNDLLEGPS